MKNTMKMVAAAVLAVGAFVSSNAFAQGNTSTDNVGVYSRIITPIKVVATEEMNLGAWYTPATTGTINLVPDGAAGGTVNNSLASTSTGLIQVSGANANANNIYDGDGVEEGIFNVSGEQGFVYSVSAPVATLSGSGVTMTSVTLHQQGAGSANTNPTANVTLPGNTVGASSTQSWNIGASATVAANASAGYHNGNIAVTATYQ